MNESPFLLMKSLQTHVLGLLREIDLLDFNTGERKILVAIKQDLGDTRLDIRDYELSETRAEQLGKAKVAKKGLERIRRGILAASEYNVFSAIDVAQLTSQLEHMSERLI